MPDNQTPETWEKRAIPYGHYTYWTVVCDSRYVAQSLAESDCDRIIAEHVAAQQRDAALEALREIHKTFNSIRVLAEQHAELTTACSCSHWDIVGRWCREELNRIEALGKEVSHE